MTKFDFISAFSDVKRADPDADLERFYSQGAWLGRCAELVYPEKKKSKGEALSKAGEAEQAKRTIADDKKKAYKDKQTPGWKILLLFNPTEEEKNLKKEWQKAEADWAVFARDRIEAEINSWHEGSPFKVNFIAAFDTECFVAKNDALMIICFRGTQPTSFRDVLADLLAWRTTSEDYDQKPHRLQQHGKVHAGFDDALRYVWSPIPGATYPQGTLSELPKAEESGEQTVWITGHSLGGALATLAADRLEMLGKLKKDQIGGVFTFGQPRVGDKNFETGYGLRDRHFRFVNNNDIVTRVPLRPLYRDVGRVVFIDRDHQLKLLQQGGGLFWHRVRSRWQALFRPFTFMRRILPGVADHFIDQYNESLGTILPPDPERTEN